MTNAELAILGLVAEKARHGYEIEQVIEQRGMREWTDIGFSSIYYLLNKLEKAALIASHQEKTEGRGPARKVYSITQAGFQALLDGTLAALATPQKGALPFLLGLANFPVVPRQQALAALKKYAQAIQQRLDHMLERAAAQQPLPPIVQAMFDYSAQLSRTEITWMENFIKQVEEGHV